MAKRSQNLYAALVFKACGAAREGRGTWESGSRAIEEALRRRGLSDGGKTVVVDGAGLAPTNRATASTVANLLLSLDADLLRGPLFHDSLAVPGEEGTLDDRLDDVPSLRGRLHAKTGTLGRRGVHAMAGYVDGEAGRPGRCFAILVNQRAWKGDARGLIDGLVRDLAAP
jgi:PBP4 family serine-type D-alanyl-D-alanine carboxypeptidase